MALEKVAGSSPSVTHFIIPANSQEMREIVRGLLGSFGSLNDSLTTAPSRRWRNPNTSSRAGGNPADFLSVEFGSKVQSAINALDR